MWSSMWVSNVSIIKLFECNENVYLQKQKRQKPLLVIWSMVYEIYEVEKIYHRTVICSENTTCENVSQEKFLERISY